MFCDGTLGENIFTDGDFGSGFLTNLPSDANGYAPGYTYQSTPPPSDGFYILTNNTSAWGSFADPNWINIGDNSADPNGYMMVVNASYEPGLFYEETVDGLCENTLYQFSADIINLLAFSGQIEPNIDFLINGQTQYSTGNISASGQWVTHGFTFSTNANTTSLTLSIRNNAPGGNGNDLAIDNIAFRACGPETFIETSIPVICAGGTATLEAEIIGSQYDTPFYQWQISTDAGGTWNDLIGENDDALFLATPIEEYQYRLLVSNSATTINNSKCRIISNVEEIKIQPSDYISFDTLCLGLELQVGNSIYNSTGIYVDSLLTSYGCDSIITTNLEILPPTNITADLVLENPLCPDESNGTISIENIQGGSAPYSYFLDDLPNQQDSVFDFLEEGTYVVSIEDSYGCIGILEAELFDPPTITAALGEDVSILLGSSYNINPQVNLPVDTFFWFPMNGLECTTDCLNPTAFPVTTTTYELIVSDEGGCTASDSITIFVDNTRRIFIPNAFTPDGDGYNDYMTIYGGVDVAEILNFKIFNRWGAVVFSNKNFQPNNDLIGWNGLVNGKKVDSGVYVYIAEILFKDGLVEKYYGDITVVE